MKCLTILPLLFILEVKVLAQEWEYLTMAVRDQLFETSLQLVGNEGWELVSSRRVISESMGVATECIFKRKKGIFNRGKSISDTQAIIITLELNYLKALQVEEERHRLKLEEEARQRFAAKERDRKRREKLTITGEKASGLLQVSTNRRWKDGIFYSINARYLNISDVTIASIKAVCIVKSQSGFETETKDKTFSANSLKPGAFIDINFLFYALDTLDFSKSNVSYDIIKVVLVE